MNTYLGDFHIHTAFSPCGDKKMTPLAIIEKALKKGLDIIAVTDHNSTLQAPVIQKLGNEKGLFVICGAEATTREGIHCLTLFEDSYTRKEFQQYLDRHLIKIKYDSQVYGKQLLYDENDTVVTLTEYFLGSMLDVSIFQLEKKVHELNGLFIPSHINRPHNSLISVFRQIPETLKADGLEIDSKYLDASPLDLFPETSSYTLIRNSDAHHPEGIGMFPSRYRIMEPSFNEIRMAMNQQNGRGIEIDF